jgi:hypothetical protein
LTTSDVLDTGVQETPLRTTVIGTGAAVFWPSQSRFVAALALSGSVR